MYQKAARNIPFSLDLAATAKEDGRNYAVSFCQLICNYALPDRPMPPATPKKEPPAETTNKNIIENEHKRNNGERLLSTLGGVEYQKEFQTTLLRDVDANAEKYLSPDALMKFSPKFHVILSNIQNAHEESLQILCSSYEGFEGLDLFAKVLEYNGFARFEIEKDVADRWIWKEKVATENAGKPRFLLFTGRESREETEILQNVFLSKWDAVPESLAFSLNAVAHNNYRGQIVRLNLFSFTNAHFHSFFLDWNLAPSKYIVHGMEPSRHPDFLEAFRSTCSDRVQIFLYIAVFSETQEQKSKHAKKTMDQLFYELFLDRKKRNEEFFSILQTI
jgi:hypothetical protein